MNGGGTLDAHLATGSTTVARCWAVTRGDGTVLGFTDHDLPLSFDGIRFAPNSGMTARAVQQGTGLAVDNSEAVGALSHDAIREADIAAGRYDRAEVRAWLVNWAAPEERRLQFRGSIGEIRRNNGAFIAELRGLTEALNQPRGRAYQKPCTAVLGDAACGVDIEAPDHRATVNVTGLREDRYLDVGPLAAFPAGWFTRGVLRVRSGEAAGLSGVVKEDRGDAGSREIELWAPLRAELAPGDAVDLIAGCDKRVETCRSKFDNFLNFRGFPDIPGEDWLMSYPARSGRNDGGRLT